MADAPTWNAGEIRTASVNGLSEIFRGARPPSGCEYKPSAFILNAPADALGITYRRA